MAVDGLTCKYRCRWIRYVVGASGAGKSSFIKMMYREELATKGEVLIEGKNVTDMKLKDVRSYDAISASSSKTLNYFLVWQRLKMSLLRWKLLKKIQRKLTSVYSKYWKWSGWSKKQDSFQTSYQVGNNNELRLPGQLSTIQRLSLLMSQQETLDPETSWEIMRIFEEINTRGTTIVMATHSQEISKQT